ncbi:hypothetical protein [Massilia sp. DWR3-1-1]|uniref:hypothetical protein n=1 Tax=Massilia sp. DWR3-1-1 TaxID=2804559 RepID=UPI003CE6A264
MKIGKKSNTIAGRLLIASGLMFFVAAAITPLPAFAGVGCAMLVIGVAVGRKGQGAA